MSGTSPPVNALMPVQSYQHPGIRIPPGVDPHFNTILTPQQEAAFQLWKQQYAPRDSGFDYDLRGAFRDGLVPAGPEAGANQGHWPD